VVMTTVGLLSCNTVSTISMGYAGSSGRYIGATYCLERIPIYTYIYQYIYIQIYI
jgi:hypothetical protein